ncbi:MAG: hypothetical protein OXU74_16295 [Gemmatimonadota bacterium]|nr:hypothetical protein [Gemmatimonadota bacterium]
MGFPRSVAMPRRSPVAESVTATATGSAASWTVMKGSILNRSISTGYPAR